MKFVFLENQASKEREKYDSFVKELSQSNIWFSLCQKEGLKVKQSLILDQEDSVLAASLFVEKEINLLPFFSFKYLYSPRGPLFKEALSLEQKKEIFFFLIKNLKENFKVCFFRFEADKDFSVIATGDKNFKKSINLQPAKTLMIDLKKNEDEILSEMHQKTRYNIKLAKRKGVEIVEANNLSLEKNFNDFWQLMKKTASRDSFNLHPKEHYRNLLLSNKEVFRLFFAEYKGNRIASGIFSFFSDKVSYLHGASDNSYRNLMSPQLLQFELIKIAKKEGYKFYDFYGIDEFKWPGVTRFKLGFGGFVFNYAGTYDFVFKPFRYYVYKILRTLRRFF